ncbi:MAG: hypothetical protein DPW09_06970 [Anaerolineae bacterium]|nr:hypothetical protein [Anaerolineae bacterium]
MTPDGTSEDDKATFIVLKENGDYIKILILPEQLDAGEGKDLHSILGLSPNDEIETNIPPTSFMMRQIPLPESIPTSEP